MEEAKLKLEELYDIHDHYFTADQPEKQVSRWIVKNQTTRLGLTSLLEEITRGRRYNPRTCSGRYSE